MFYKGGPDSHEKDFVRVGLLINPHSRVNRREALTQKMRDCLGSDSVVQTQGLDELPGALDRLLRERRHNVLAICGGDGTIHHTLNALVKYIQAPSLGESVPRRLPKILLLRGGTMNILAHALGTGTKPLQSLRAFNQYVRARRLHELPTRDIPFLHIHTSEFEERYGFVFGSDLTVAALELYEVELGGGYRGLMRFVYEAAYGFVRKTPLWNEYSHYLAQPAKRMLLNGKSHMLKAAVASSIDIKLLNGWVVGLRFKSKNARSMQVRTLGDVSVAQIVKAIPLLAIGQGGRGIRDHVCKDLVLDGDFSLDGEIFRSQNPRENKITVSCAPWTLPVIIPPKK